MNSFENNYNHLDDKINPKEILETPIHLIDKTHLSKLWEHFKNIREKNALDPEVFDAANNIISKIDNIMNFDNFSKSRISWEIMQASNNPDYTINSKVA